MTKLVEDHELISVNHLGGENYVLSLRATVELPEIKPGNFAEILVPDTGDVFLRRPFSILDTDHNNKTISFYIKGIGKGTRKLCDLNPGAVINLIYPLGNHFTLPENSKKVLIIGGGSGIAPFILLGKELQKSNSDVTFLLGGRSASDILLTDEFSKYGNINITTEDGSLGEKGLVTQHSIFKDEKFDFDQIYTCGPDPMMHAVAQIAMQKGIECEASLENTMACGFGVCLCCVTPTHEGNKRVCMEGPVFNVNNLKWQI